jgi:hypothetical protein
MPAKYTIVYNKKDGVTTMVCLTQEALDELTRDGAIILGEKKESVLAKPAETKPWNEGTALNSKSALDKKKKKSKSNGKGNQYGHTFSGRHINQNRRLSRAGVEDIVFSDTKPAVLRKKWKVSKTLIDGLRTRITGDHNEKMKQIRAITAAPKSHKHPHHLAKPARRELSDIPFPFGGR